MSATSLPISAKSRPRGWWGMLLFAASEATLIGALIGSYVYLRLNATEWPPRNTPEPSLLAPIVLSAVLLATMVPFRRALAAARSGRHGKTVAFLLLATALQAAYFGIQVHLFDDNLRQFTPQQSAYASIYYVLLGAAHAHVAVGLLLDLWLLARLSTRLTAYRLAALEAAALYWYVVAGVTLAVVLTELSPRL